MMDLICTECYEPYELKHEMAVCVYLGKSLCEGCLKHIKRREKL